MSKKTPPKFGKTAITAEYYSHCTTCDQVLMIIKVPKAQIRSLDTEGLIWAVEDMPNNATAHLVFEVLAADPREVWQIEEIRRYVQQALATCPQILSRFTQDDQVMMRNCVCDVAYTAYPNGVAQPVLFDSPEWMEIAQAAGIDPEVLA